MPYKLHTIQIECLTNNLLNSILLHQIFTTMSCSLKSSTKFNSLLEKGSQMIRHTTLQQVYFRCLTNELYQSTNHSKKRQDSNEQELHCILINPSCFQISRQQTPEVNMKKKQALQTKSPKKMVACSRQRKGTLITSKTGEYIEERRANGNGDLSFSSVPVKSLQIRKLLILIFLSASD